MKLKKITTAVTDHQNESLKSYAGNHPTYTGNVSAVVREAIEWFFAHHADPRYVGKR